MADKNSELIARFSDVTGANAERARFYLESSAWNLDLAMTSFFDNDDGADEGADVAPAASNPPPAATQPPAAPQGGGAWPAPQAKSRFATIDSMKQQVESDSSEEEGEAFYAGGSEHGGGQQVLGPPRKKKDTDKFVQDMFQAAKEHGAEEEEGESSTSRPTRGPTFRGAGYRLGDNEQPSLVVPGLPVQSQPRQVDMVLKMWRNGFSIDDGPVREYADPTNQEFLNAIKKGEVPRELIREARGGEVNLSMEDHREEEYVKPKIKAKPFGGEGHRLGSPVGGAVTTSPAPPPTATVTSAAASATTVSVDKSKPTTNLQIRLADGSRMVTEFNHSHTVADVRQHIVQARPQFAMASFVLMTTFPNKELTNESETLSDAKLLNAVLVQRVK